MKQPADYVIYEDDVILPYISPESIRALHFNSDDEDGKGASDVFVSAGIWLAENRDMYDTIVGSDVTYDDNVISLRVVVDGATW